jgi:hypothetical protein
MRSVFLLLFAIAAQGALAQGAPVVVRQSVSPAHGIVIGQRVTLAVDVLFESVMTRPPRVTIPEVPGIQIFRFETQGTTMSDRIDGAPYTGQRFEFALFPRRGGSFTVPPAAVTLLDRDGNPTGTATGSPMRLEVRVPEGVDPSTPVIASTDLRLSETWSRPAGEGVRVGDALKRTILREVVDVPALAMLPVADIAPDGVRVYRKPVAADDRTSRGSLTGRRTDTLTYLFERVGSFVLPAIDQPWWDLDDGRLKQESVPGLTVTVEAALVKQEARSDRSPVSTRSLVLMSASLVLAMIAAWLARWLGPRLAAAGQDIRRRRESSEPAAFRNLRRAATSGAAGETYRAAAAWREHVTDDVRAAADDALDPLERHLFGPGQDAASWTPSDGPILLSRLGRIRRTRSRAGQHRTSSLPPLNPVPHP